MASRPEDAPPKRPIVRRSLVGRPLATEREDLQLLSKRLALPIFASDALSSVAYATEAALAVLVAQSVASRDLVFPISLVIVALMAIVVTSYRQTIDAYPTGGGAYVVSRENLGVGASLVAGASLLIDYVLTVAVSIAAGALALTSAFPELSPYLLELSLGFLVLLVLGNLRGLREAGSAFALPTYVFVAAMYLLLGVGIVRGLVSGWPRAHVPDPATTGTAAGVGLVVVLRSFASGSSALTGVEAIANGVRAFRPPQARNARATLTIMGTIAITLFLGVSLLAWQTDARPSRSVSVLSEVADASFGSGAAGRAGFYLVQFSTLLVLVLAANTAFQGFPRLSALIAQDGFVPRQLQNLGDRLVFSNGIVILAVLAALLLVGFNARVDRLIHLYLLGVFVAFTLSQAGMVRHWHRQRLAGGSRRSVLPRLAVNAIGAVATGVVAVVVVFTRFTQGAWMVLVAIPVLVALFVAIHRHYQAFAARLRRGYRVRTDRRRPGPVLVFVERLDEATSDAIRYARVIGGEDVEAVHVPPSNERSDLWRAWGSFSGGLPLRQLPLDGDEATSIIAHLDHLARRPEEFVTVVIPETFDGPSLIAQLRRRSSLLLKLRLLNVPGVAIADVPVVRTAGRLPSPARSRTHVLVLVAAVNDPTLRALDYALSLRATSVKAIHIALGTAETEGVLRDWQAADLPIPLQAHRSPYRDLGGPLLDEVRAITRTEDGICSVVMPEVILTKRWERLLHNRRALFVKRLLLFEDRVILTDVPFQVDTC